MASLKSLNCCISATLTTPQDEPSSTNPRPPTKVILPKKKPEKWSTGTAPGDYGGPPTTIKLRKYWGGKMEDPITSTDFIWNKDFMTSMKKFILDPETNPPPAPEKEKPSGFLSLNRVMSLDSMDIDLSKELSARPKPVMENIISPASPRRTTPRWKLVPTRREQEKWDKASKVATDGTEVLLRETRRPRGDPAVLAAESREQYIKLRNKLQLLTVGIGGVGLVSAYVSYTPEITVSFGIGFIGSLAYMRMLGNSIGAMGEGAKGFLKAAIGQPRLLVPVVLVMVYNRWNGILVPEYDWMHLDLIPMLVGFFTYKIATFIQALEEAVAVEVKP